MQTFVSNALKRATPAQRVDFLDALRKSLSEGEPKLPSGRAVLSDLDMMCATHEQQCEALSAAGIEWGAPVQMWLLVGSLDLGVAQCGPDFLILDAKPEQMITPQIAWLLLTVHGVTQRICFEITGCTTERRISVDGVKSCPPSRSP